MTRASRAALPLDASLATRELVRALRGKRSQRALSARLGYRVNVLTGWESGRRSPPAHQVLRLAARVGIDVRARLTAFDARLGPALEAQAPSTEAGIAALVSALIDERTHADVARALGESRSTMARWAHGQVVPRFSDLLRVVAECTHRVVDFVACFADPASISAVAREHARIEAQRLLLREDPALAAVLPALTLRAYRRLARHREGWLAARVGITREQEARGLALLEAAGAVRRGKNGKYDVVHDRRVDVRADREAVTRLQQHWAHVAASRAGLVPGDVTRFHLVSVAEEDLDALRTLLAQLFERVDQRLAEVRDPERVVLVGVMLHALDTRP